MEVEKTGHTYILFRWNSPRKYGTVKSLMQTFLKSHYDLEPVVTNPPPTVASSAAEMAASAAQVVASTATQVAVSAATQVAASTAQPAHLTSSRLPAGFLALKLHAHIYHHDIMIDKPSTTGLSIFFDMFIKQGTFRQGEKTTASHSGGVLGCSEM